jgi:hypothetical protein
MTLRPDRIRRRIDRVGAIRTRAFEQDDIPTWDRAATLGGKLRDRLITAIASTHPDFEKLNSDEA